MKNKTGLLICVSALVLSLGVTLGIEAAKCNAEQAEAIEAASKVALEATPSSNINIYRFTVPHDFGSDAGNHIYLHAWGSDGGDTSWGNFITVSDFSYNENDERMYTLSTDYTYTGFIIIKEYNNPDSCKTQDINVGSDTAWYWDGNKGASASAWTPTNQTYYLYDYTDMFGGNAKCYAWQSNGSLTTDAYPGVAMTKAQYGSGHLYSVSLDPAFDKCKFGIGDSANTGDVWINRNRGQCYCWWKAGDVSWSEDFDWLYAHDWVYNTMHVRDIPKSSVGDSGACRGSAGYYQKAKTAYNSFSSSIKTKISEDGCFDIAEERLIAWARANGDTVSVSNSTFSFGSARSNVVVATATGDSTATVVIISLVAVGAVASYFFLAKKKKSL